MGNYQWFDFGIFRLMHRPHKKSSSGWQFRDVHGGALLGEDCLRLGTRSWPWKGERQGQWGGVAGCAYLLAERRHSDAATQRAVERTAQPAVQEVQRVSAGLGDAFGSHVEGAPSCALATQLNTDLRRAALVASDLTCNEEFIPC